MLTRYEGFVVATTILLGLLWLGEGIAVIVIGSGTLNHFNRYSEYVETYICGAAICFIFIGSALLASTILSAVASCCLFSMKGKREQPGELTGGNIMKACCACNASCLSCPLVLAAFVALITCAAISSVKMKEMDHAMNSVIENCVANYYKNDTCRERMDSVQYDLNCCGSNSSEDYKLEIPKSCPSTEAQPGCTKAVEDSIVSRLNVIYIFCLVVLVANFVLSLIVEAIKCCIKPAKEKQAERNQRFSLVTSG
ncbi:unnamed protein product [Calicophoron daubneyi]|uniref:Tetraspanin n=1 Tax=Calicophoron daubneyi TaxID=300641 RepID=A0AAV2TNJ3_CALDB